MASAWRTRVRGGLEQSRWGWMAVPMLLLAALAYLAVDQPGASGAWMVAVVWIVSLTVAGGLEMSRRPDETLAAQRGLDVCTVVALLPILVAAATVVWVALFLPAERGLTFDLDTDAQLGRFVGLAVVPVLVPVLVASVVILRRRGSALEVRLQVVGWAIIALFVLLALAFPANINIGASGPVLVFLAFVFAPVVRRILWPLRPHAGALPVPTYRPV